MIPDDSTFAVVGASGAVGLELLALLASDGVPPDRVAALTSARSAGTDFPFGETTITAQELSDDTIGGRTIALFAATGSVAREWAPRAVERGSVVIDNSSAYRMDPAVPLVVPEVNGGLIAGDPTPRIIANPNCSTIILLMGVHPLARAFGVERIAVSTYQAASGAGIAAMRELESNTRRALDDQDQVVEAFHEPCAFNVFSHDSGVDPATGRNVEEQKMIDETRKITGDPSLDVRPTCLRVPVLRTHSESVEVTLAGPATEDEVRAALDAMPGVTVMDDREHNRFPTSLAASGSADVFVGRIRAAPPDAGASSREYAMLLVGDQLLKGAALNAWQIARAVLGGSGEPKKSG